MSCLVTNTRLSGIVSSFFFSLPDDKSPQKLTCSNSVAAMNFSYIVSKSLFNLEILVFLIVRPGVQLLIFLAPSCPLFQVFSALGRVVTRTGWSNSLSPPIQFTEAETQCWLFYRLPKTERSLYLSDTPLHEVLLPDGCFALSPAARWRVPPWQAAARQGGWAAPSHAADAEKVGVAAQGMWRNIRGEARFS